MSNSARRRQWSKEGKWVVKLKSSRQCALGLLTAQGEGHVTGRRWLCKWTRGYGRANTWTSVWKVHKCWDCLLFLLRGFVFLRGGPRWVSTDAPRGRRCGGQLCWRWAGSEFCYISSDGAASSSRVWNEPNWLEADVEFADIITSWGGGGVSSSARVLYCLILWAWVWVRMCKYNAAR